MSIQTVGSLQNIINNHDSSKWTKSVDFSEFNDLNFDSNEFKELDSSVKSNKTFGEFLTDSIKDVNSMQVEANKAMERLATGESKDIEGVMMAANRAEIAFKTMNKVRSKVIDAYKDIMRMQL